jgi:tRNA(adenine34) deaminase
MRRVTRALQSHLDDPTSAGDAADRDVVWMEAALAEARAAESEDEVPIGAVVVVEGRIVAAAHNRTRALCDPTAHAEMIAIRECARTLGAMRVPGAVVYTTVEPCFMCAGALSHARVARVVWAVRDPKFGGCVSLGSVFSDPRLNHRVEFTEGVCADEARALLQQFFRSKRRTLG